MAGKGGKRAGAGRKTKDEEKRIRDITSPYCTNAIKIVVDILTDKESKAADRLSAAKLLLSYAYGLPKQTVEQTNLNIEQPLFPDVSKNNINK